MGRVLKAFLCIACFATASASASADDAPSPHRFNAGADLSFVSANGYDSWTEGSVGKLRYSNGDSILLSRAFVDSSIKLTETVDVNLALEAYTDDLGSFIGATEAFLEWRPVPRSANKYRFKFGAFYPRVSLENVAPGWSSPYTISSSAINTWVAEELRVFGTELSISRRLNSSHTLSLQGAVFVNNDPAGSLLAWKGWSVHDRQTRFNDKLPLPPLPQIQPGRMFAAQDPYVAPFREVDDRAGYYLNGEWQFSKALLFRAMHYDNRADPTKIRNGQYAWTTRFNHAGLQATIPGEFGLIAQWMDGTTVMGPVINGAHAVDAEYQSYYLLLTRAIGRHRLTARYDNFDVSQNDRIPEDNNPEKGHAWTLSYRIDYSQYLEMAAEWMSIKTHRCAHAYYGLSPDVTETQFQLTARLKFGNQH